MSKRQFSYGLTLLKSLLAKVISFFHDKLRLFFKKYVKIGGGGGALGSL
ncbi:MAG: hypothetical protein LBG58_01655 [Planctomycetaceae bacterium]|jgi:hypothetical protein|nr:hypothetical protein [Planctomycetaceae bacterium]